MPCPIVYPIRRLRETREGETPCVSIVIIAVAAILTPAALSAARSRPPGAIEVATDLSAAKKKKKKAAKPKEEYLKGASGLPSGPQRPTPQY